MLFELCTLVLKINQNKEKKMNCENYENHATNVLPIQPSYWLQNNNPCVKLRFPGLVNFTVGQ